jgi:signal peptidase II
LNRKVAVFLVILIVLGCDQALKIWVKLNMAYASDIQLIGKEFFRLHFVENNGMAFGITFGGEMGKLFLTLFRIVAVCALSYFIKLLIDKKSSYSLIISFGLILAGALGNIIDSTFYGLLFSDSFHGGVAEFMPAEGGYGKLFHGKVVDMLHLVILRGVYPDWVPYLGNTPFLFFKPVFNIADVAISAGVINIILFQRAFFKGESTEEQELEQQEKEGLESVQTEEVKSNQSEELKAPEHRITKEKE